jgi:hypothetical protein
MTNSLFLTCTKNGEPTKVALSRYLQVAKQNQAVYDKDNVTGATVGVFAG